MPPGEGTVTFPYEVDLLEAMRADPPRRTTSRSAPAPSASAARPGSRATPWSSRCPWRRSPSRRTRTRPRIAPTSPSWASLRSSLRARGPEVQPGLAALAAAQPARGPAAGQRGLHALVHAARGTLQPRDRGHGPADGPKDRRAEPAASCPEALAPRPEQPRRGEADRAGGEGRARLRRPVPGGRGAHRARGSRSRRWTAGRRSGIFFVAYAPARTHAESPEITLEFVRDGQVVGRAEPALPPADAEGRIPYVVSIPARGSRPGATRCGPSSGTARPRLGALRVPGHAPGVLTGPLLPSFEEPLKPR